MENIKSYAYDNSKIGNGWDGWKDEYANFLKEKVFGESKRRYPCVYCDPDEGNTEYYIRLCQFLNVQEKIISEDKRFSYCVEEYNKVCRIRVYKDGESKFYLKSDQFGFSAPMKKNGAVVPHPFGKYYEKENDKKKAIENIVEWIYTTRSLGGAFIWPEVKGTSYNMLRGGKIPRFNGRYMQDRVDLALLEVLHFLASNDEQYEIDYKEDMLYSQIKNEDSHMREWLEHFGTFETFVNFFHFDDFVVVEQKGNSIVGVKSIINGKKLNDIGRKNCELPQDAEGLNEVFDRITYMIKERTKKINIKIMEKEIKA